MERLVIMASSSVEMACRKAILLIRQKSVLFIMDKFIQGMDMDKGDPIVRYKRKITET